MKERKKIAVCTPTKMDSEEVQRCEFSRGRSWESESQTVRRSAYSMYGADSCIVLQGGGYPKFTDTITYGSLSFLKDRGFTILSMDEYRLQYKGIPLPTAFLASVLGLILDGEEVKKVGELEAIAADIDEYGQLKEEITKLETKAKNLRASIDARGLSLGQHDGRVYSLTISEVPTSELIPERVENLLGHDKFLKLTKVLKNQAEKVMTKDEMDQCSTDPKFIRKYATRRL